MSNSKSISVKVPSGITLIRAVKKTNELPLLSLVNIRWKELQAINLEALSNFFPLINAWIYTSRIVSTSMQQNDRPLRAILETFTGEQTNIGYSEVFHEAIKV